MAFGVGIKFDLRPFMTRLELAGKNVRKEAMKALRAGAKPVIAEVQTILGQMENKPGWEHTGLTAKSIGVISAGQKRGAPGILRLKIGARPGFKISRKTGQQTGTRFRLVFTRRASGRQYVHVPANILHLLELGTRPHAVGEHSSLRKDVQHGDMHPGARPYPSLRPASEHKKEQARAIVAAMLKKAVER